MRPARAILGLTVATALAMAAGACVFGVPPVWITGPFLFVYVTVVQLGVYFPNLGVFQHVVVRGPAGARGVALTFDDGPHPVHTREVLALLDAFGAKATFFVLGDKAERHRDVLREIGARGHAIGVHGFTHDPLFCVRSERRIRADLERTMELIEAETGSRPRFFRPPLGFTTPRTSAVCRALGLELVGYSARAYDGLDTTSFDRLFLRVAPGIVDGAIVLLHDSAERGDRRPMGVIALRSILERMAALGLPGVALPTFVPIAARSTAGG
ncbi:MAG: polysaccharide deacetylase family protein [Polyangiaceae bacterium]